MEYNGIACHFIQTDTADSRLQPAEVSVAQLFAQSDSFEYLCAPVGTDCADAHFAHNLEQAFANGFDVVFLGCGIVQLYLLLANQLVEYGKCHVGVQCACTETKKQCGVHHFAYLAAFHHQCGLHAFSHRDEMVVHRRYGKQCRYGGVRGVYVAVGQYNVVHAFGDGLFGLLAQTGKRFLQSGASFGCFKQHRQLYGFETLVTDVAENIQLCICQDRVGQPHHFAMAFVGSQYVHAHCADILCERHHQLFTNRIDGRVGDLCKLLAEVVVEQLRSVGKYGKRGVVAHCADGFGSVGCHGQNDLLDVFFGEAERA